MCHNYWSGSCQKQKHGLWFDVSCLSGVLPPERGPAQRTERPGGSQPADGERGEGVLRGAVSPPEAAEGGRHGQAGPEGHAGLRPGGEPPIILCIIVVFSWTVNKTSEQKQHVFCGIVDMTCRYFVFFWVNTNNLKISETISIEPWCFADSSV